MKTQQSKTNGCSKSSSKREVYSDKHLRHQTQKLSNEQRKTEKKEQAKPKDDRRKEIIKIKTEISETQAKEKTIEKMTDTKSWFFKKILKKENDSSERGARSITSERKKKKLNWHHKNTQAPKVYEQIYAKKIYNLEKRDYSFLKKKKFLGTIS